MKVFLVEDALQIRQRLQATVEEAGGEVVGAADTEQAALRGLLATHPDVVITDLFLAEGNGIEVVRRVKMENPETIVIVLTNFSGNPFRKVCLDYGADYFLDKTADFQRFEALVEGFARATR